MPGAMLRRAGMFALAELAAGLTIGGFLIADRAETAVFVAVRPWVLVALVAWVLPSGWRERLASYGAALLLATLSGALLILLLGAPPGVVAIEGARGAAAGLLLAMALDAAALLARGLRFAPRLLALLLGVAILALPGPLRLYERVAMPSVIEPVDRDVPVVAVITGLPLFWGDADPNDPIGSAAERPQAIVMIERAFRLRPVDEVHGIGAARVALIVQPRRLDQRALDQWISRGGRALMLVDPMLEWDVRDPPPSRILAPLLSRWGVAIEPVARGDVRVDLPGGRAQLASPGRIVIRGGSCTVAAYGQLADCAIGRGRAIILADADILDDSGWVGPGAIGATRQGQIAANPQVIVALLRQLAGGDSPESRSIRWIGTDRSVRFAVAMALILPLGGLLWGLALGRRNRRATG